jgi:hypothetical protein
LILRVTFDDKDPKRGGPIANRAIKFRPFLKMVPGTAAKEKSNAVLEVLLAERNTSVCINT